VIVSQPGCELATLHGHPAAATTSTVPPDAPKPKVAELDVSEYAQAAPDCVTMKFWPAQIEPVRLDPLLLAATVKFTMPFPETVVVGDKTVIQLTLLKAVQEQVLLAVTVMLPGPPAAPNDDVPLVCIAQEEHVPMLKTLNGEEVSAKRGTGSVALAVVTAVRGA
jgi:hypothetical protein